MGSTGVRGSLPRSALHPRFPPGVQHVGPRAVTKHQRLVRIQVAERLFRTGLACSTLMKAILINPLGYLNLARPH
jgi:hypothetical protein